MPPGSSAEITAATYNLYLGADLSLLLGRPAPEELADGLQEVRRQLLATAFPRRCSAVADLLARERPDVVGLQELCRWSVDDRLLWDFEALLLDALAERGTPYDVVACVASFRGQGTLDWDGETARVAVVGANAVLRRRDSAVRVTGVSSGVFDAALGAAPGGDVQVSVARGWCGARLDLPGDPGPGLTVVDTHTEAHDPATRDRQAAELAAVLPEGPVVVLADLNANPAEVRLPTGCVDAWTAAGHPEGPAAATSGQAPDLSNQTSSLSERVDYVLVRGLEVVGCHRFGADPRDRAGTGLWPSDHAGVVASLRL